MMNATAQGGAGMRTTGGVWHGTAEIERNAQVAEDTYLVRLGCAEIAERIVPGQFVMVRIGEGDDPLLGRPLALYDTVVDKEGRPQGIDVVYLVVGKMTTRLSRMRAGQSVQVWGPLGNGFEAKPCDHLVMVAGGIGQTPFLAVAREALSARSYGARGDGDGGGGVGKVTLCYGARRKSFLAGVEDFEAAGVTVRVSTDDGSAGHHGLVTDLLAEVVEAAEGSCRVVCCGPEPMMAAVSEWTSARGVACEVSLETPMACGLGICFSCVAKVRTGDGEWDYRRTCVEGPVFDATRILFD